MRPFVTVRIICGILLGKRTNLACMQVRENLCTFQIFQLEQTFSSLSHPVRAVLKPRAPDTSNYKASIPVGEQMCQLSLESLYSPAVLFVTPNFFPFSCIYSLPIHLPLQAFTLSYPYTNTQLPMYEFCLLFPGALLSSWLPNSCEFTFCTTWAVFRWFCPLGTLLQLQDPRR